MKNKNRKEMNTKEAEKNVNVGKLCQRSHMSVLSF